MGNLAMELIGKRWEVYNKNSLRPIKLFNTRDAARAFKTGRPNTKIWDRLNQKEVR